MDSDGGSQKKHTGNSVWTLFRSIRALRPNRNFWTFLIFLGVSVLFWCIQTFNEYTSITVSYDIRLVNLPSDRILTSYIPKSVSVSLSGRGFSILGEMFGNKHNIVEIDYSSLPKNDECATVDFSTWKKLLSKVLDDDISISSVSVSPLEIYTSVGKHKQVPVISKVRMSTAKDYVLLSSEITPQYVNVYAPNSIFDTISAVFTEELTYSSLSDTTSATVAIEPIKGVKVVPDSVRLTMCVDLLTTKVVKVPITIENLPENYVVKTFPHEIDVTFKISSSSYRTINVEDFSLVVDYLTLDPSQQKCKVILRSKPSAASSVKINPSYVEYIIEKCK